MLDKFTPNQSHRLAVSARDAARLLGISRSQVFKLLAAKQFPVPVRLGKRNPRWLIADLETFLQKGGCRA